MNNNWESLIRAIVPLSFMAIWALTSLFNRDAKPKPIANTFPDRLGPRPDSRPAVGPRAGDPTLRWATPGNLGQGVNRPPARRPATRTSSDDGIVILSSNEGRNDRTEGRSLLGTAARRPTKGKPVLPARKVEPAPNRAKLAGVNQNVNQQLANTSIDMVPLATLSPAAAMPSLGLSSAPTATPDSIAASPRSAAAMALSDPAKLREAFLLNVILSPPVSMRMANRSLFSR